MNKEWLMIAAMGVGGFGFSIGGLDRLKWVRRYLMPCLLGLIAVAGGLVWWTCLISVVLLIAALHMGYGHKVPYWRKVITASSWAAATLVMGFTPWQLIAPVLFMVMFWMSNQETSADTFLWKICEFFTGGAIGTIVAHLISRGVV